MLNSSLKKKIKAGVIGLGVGEEHLRGYLEHPSCEVKAICDFQEDKLSRIGKKFSIAERTKDSQNILNDPEIEVVSICSYDNYHAQQVIQALENGKHVMVEKPICLNKKDARNIIRAAEKSGKKLTSNLILRKSPRFIQLKEKINQGILGEIFYIEGDYLYGRGYKITDGWRGKLDFYCGIYGAGIHMIDLLLWLVGDEIEEVFSYGNKICTKNSSFKFEDCIISIFKFRNGCIGKSVSSLSCIQPHFHSLKIYGTKSTFINDYKEATLFTSVDIRDCIKIRDSYPGVKRGELIPNFIDAILNDREPFISKRDVFKTMSVCFAAHDSLIAKHPIKVEYLI